MSAGVSWPLASRAWLGRLSLPPIPDLVVDLSAEPLGARWVRGALTLAGLCSATLLLAPGFAPLAAPVPPPPAAGAEAKLMAFAPLAQPQADAIGQPTQPPVDADGTPAKAKVASDGERTRVTGQVAGGLYWSLREAGISPDVAADYLRALASRIDVGADVAPFDRFDLVIDGEAGAAGQVPLLYAALHRAQGDDVQLVKWAQGGKADWFDAAGTEKKSDQMMAPVAGRITSRFGRRVHPIFRFARMHSGIDFGAGWGSPIVAAADGTVAAAGWSGGYGKQVRIAHDGGIATTYSHMSSIAAAPGTPVRQGEVIGYVGSTGISTGPHLHFEVRVGGRAVDPLSVQMASRPVMEGRELAAFKARFKQLTAIGATAS